MLPLVPLDYCLNLLDKGKPKHKFNAIDPFTVDRTGDSNGVFETMRREIFHFNIFLLSLHFARFLCINILEHEENLTGPTLESEELIICFCSF